MYISIVLHLTGSSQLRRSKRRKKTPPPPPDPDLTSESEESDIEEYHPRERAGGNETDSDAGEDADQDVHENANDNVDDNADDSSDDEEYQPKWSNRKHRVTLRGCTEPGEFFSKFSAEEWIV